MKPARNFGRRWSVHLLWRNQPGIGVDLTMKKFVAATALALLAGCQSTPLEDDARYTRFARVVDVHVFNEAERKEAAKTEPRYNQSGVSMGIGLGYGTGGGFGGIGLGYGTSLSDGRSRHIPPLVSRGATRFTVQPLNSGERIELLSYGKFQVGDCVKLFSGHPTEYARLFDLKPGERCE
jgi:hypothetical protein